jgi:hypothetical protein
MKPHIEITHGDQIATIYRPFNGSTIDIGIMLASAARVVAQGFRQQLSLPESEDAAILAQIVMVFNNDIEMGSMGEKATLEDLTIREKELK